MILDALSALVAKLPEIAANKAVSVVERRLAKPVKFRSSDHSRARSIVPRLRKAKERSDWVSLPGSPGRAAFLSAARQLLRDQPVEWMIVGLGTSAKRSYVKEAFVQQGTSSSVRLPVSVQAQIKGHLEDVPGAEIINIHNHPDGLPRELKNFLLGDAPITSDGDRRAQQAHDEVARTAAAKTLSNRTVRFYVVENGQLHEYWLPTQGRLRDPFDEFFQILAGAARRA